MNDYVVIIKLITGEDIIAVIVDEEDTHVEIEKPYSLSHRMTTGQVAFMPYNIYSDDTNFIIQTSSIITINSASSKVADTYFSLIDQPKQRITDVDDLEKAIDDLEKDYLNQYFPDPETTTKH